MYPLTNKKIVLDIDETLVNTRESLDSIKGIDLSDPDVSKRFYSLFLPPDYFHVWGVMRPGCKEFLSFCFDYFDKVIVWSAGEEKYVRAVVDRIFEGLPEPDGIFSRAFCDTHDNNTTKPLLKLQQHFPDIDLTNTLILDDREHNSLSCNPDNAIIIPAYRQDDDALYKVMEWLLLPEVKSSREVRELDKSDIFSRPLPRIPYSLSFRTRTVPSMAWKGDLPWKQLPEVIG
jgi:TFIIF-interacting CTD phosphatase-like protein